MSDSKKIYVFVGLPGSGKTTKAIEKASELGLFHVYDDVIGGHHVRDMKIVFDKGKVHVWHGGYDGFLEVMELGTRDLVATSLELMDQQVERRFRKVAHAFGYECMIERLDEVPEVCWQRILQDFLDGKTDVNRFSVRRDLLGHYRDKKQEHSVEHQKFESPIP